MIKTFLSALSVILFSIPIITYSFFPSSNLNIWLSTQPILAQIYAFPLATATMAAILSFVFFFLSFYKKNKQIRFYSGILLLLSLILLLFGTDKTLSSASNKTKTLKLVTWNVANQIEAQHIERIFSHFDADMAIFPELATNIRGEQ
ncbi:endonuclease/exonuclease/phosphatase family [Streptococcus pneumoniae]|nr:endonuclease/exonuclease/phosphatase family [Streptococcus pneumoniae]VQE97610.1 endonuclease/exonuclease/phosphatase family [Streptococcus pneumoniae]VSM37955.1 endonuclease/exonuclease/phosphatase family [Streptococcus pneumoniae]